MGKESSQNEEPLVVSGHFNYSRREPKDRFWAYAYAACLAFTVIGGIVTVKHRNPLYKKVTEDYLKDPRHCPYDAAGRNMLRGAAEGDFNMSTFLEDASMWLVISAGGSILVGVAFLHLFRHYAGVMTRLTIASQVAVPLALGLGAMASGQYGVGFMMLGLSALAALTFYLWRAEIELCSRLLSVSAHGLHDNPGLVFFVIVAQLVSAVVVIGQLALTMFAYEHGDVVPNSLREGSRHCVDSQGASVPCCEWSPSPWARSYMSITSLVLLWTVLLFAELRVYVVAGTVAQWYFQPPGSSSTKGTTLRSVRHALGPSFGSLALGSAILTAVQIARQIVEETRQKARNGEGGLLALAASVAGCILECFYTLIEYLTKFATVMMSITGESFFDAGRSVTDLLTRNFLKAYGVWWFPPLVIQLGAFMLSAAWGLGLYAATYFALKHSHAGHQEAIILGLLAFFMALVVLSFFGSVLLNIVDAVFVCYALDRDTQTVSRPEVHEVFSQVPVGAVIEQPDGELAYGAPQLSPRVGGGARVAYVPPAQQQGLPPSQQPGPSAPPLGGNYGSIV